MCALEPVDVAGAGLAALNEVVEALEQPRAVVQLGEAHADQLAIAILAVAEDDRATVVAASFRCEVTSSLLGNLVGVVPVHRLERLFHVVHFSVLSR
jgi:hypothetical protein